MVNGYLIKSIGLTALIPENIQVYWHRLQIQLLQKTPEQEVPA